MKRGLVVGKFMPLHRGHQFLLESALAVVDDLTVVVYDSHPEGDYPEMPVEARARWISELYPQMESIVVRQDIYDETVPQEVKDAPEAAQAYADDLSFLGRFDYVFSSESYGDAFAAALGAEHICIDQAREMMPVSGTMLRESLYTYRAYIDPVVYRTLIQKVVFVGTESSGKSTLAKAMAERLGTRWVHEYGRELWEAQNLTGTFPDQLKIGFNQYRREEAAVLHSDRYLFCDTNAWTTLQWFLMSHGATDIRLQDLVERTKHEYIWFLCENDFGWIQDGTRELVGLKSRIFQEQNKYGLDQLGVEWHSIGGSLEQRVQTVCDALLLPVGFQGGTRK